VNDRGHRSVAHTADVIIEAWGPDLAACCEEAVAALVDTYLDAVDPHVAVERRAVVVGPGSPEALLVDLLDEIIFVLDTSPLAPVGADVRLVGDDELAVDVALAELASVEPTGSVPKAISRSGLLVHHDANGFRCSVLVDV
jgi:SHS2 domain-containing protein